MILYIIEIVVEAGIAGQVDDQPDIHLLKMLIIPQRSVISQDNGIIFRTCDPDEGVLPLLIENQEFIHKIGIFNKSFLFVFDVDLSYLALER